MRDIPRFPEFKPLELADRPVLHPRIWRHQPKTSELTFGNLYLWRSYYHFEWSIQDDWLLVVAKEREGGHYALPPVGPASRADVTAMLLDWMRDGLNEPRPRIARAGQRLADELKDDHRFCVVDTRDHFDYIYRTEDLAELTGRRYSAKRNHINQFTRYYEYEYQPVTRALVDECLALAEVWCEQRLCDEDLSLQHELSGIEDVLKHIETLEVDGGAIAVQGKVQAFALGELLNETTAVFHVEKANPEFKGIYPMMTQCYAQRWQGEAAFINMEQDLGEPGLRRAKESYHPDHLEAKFTVTLAEH